MDHTYDQHIRKTYEPIVKLAREFEKTLGKKKTHEIIKELSERDAAREARESEEREHIEGFQGFLA